MANEAVHEIVVAIERHSAMLAEVVAKLDDLNSAILILDAQVSSLIDRVEELEAEVGLPVEQPPPPVRGMVNVETGEHL